MKKIHIKSIIFGFMVIILSMVGSYLSTSYALTESGYAIDSKDVEYIDNSSLGVTNVQAAIDGTCTKFSDQLTNLKKAVISEMYPKGSIYITTELTTASEVAAKLGGSWESYGSGRTLVGNDGTNYITNDSSKGSGGSTTVSTKLTTANLPSHSHTINHTHTTESKSITNGKAENTTSTWLVRESSSRTGSEFVGENTTVSSLTLSDDIYGDGTKWFWNVKYTNTHAHTVTGTIPSLSTISISKTTSGSTGSGTAFTTSTMQPYIVVYMYKRIS